MRSKACEDQTISSHPCFQVFGRQPFSQSMKAASRLSQLSPKASPWRDETGGRDKLLAAMYLFVHACVYMYMYMYMYMYRYTCIYIYIYMIDMLCFSCWLLV